LGNAISIELFSLPQHKSEIAIKLLQECYKSNDGNGACRNRPALLTVS